MKERLSIIIPAYNEARRLPKSLLAIDAYFPEESKPLEIIVVDDGSEDDTSTVVKELGEQIPYLKLSRLESNRGKGAAVRDGVLAAKGELILFSDADLSTPIEEWQRFEEAFQAGADIVIGVRTLPGARIEKRQPLYRVLLGKTFNRTIRLLLGLPYSDTQCGFKAFRKDAAKEIFELCRTDGFAFDVEVLLLAKMKDYSISERPVRWINDADSRVSMARHGLAILREIIKIKQRLRGNI